MKKPLLYLSMIAAAMFTFSTDRFPGTFPANDLSLSGLRQMGGGL